MSPEESPTQTQRLYCGVLAGGPVCVIVFGCFAVLAALVFAVIWVRCCRSPMELGMFRLLLIVQPPASNKDREEVLMRPRLCEPGSPDSLLR